MIKIEPWQDRAACATPLGEGLNFFSPDSDMKYKCRALCMSNCPVRFNCLNSALENEDIVGIWGGVDDYEIRRALSVDHEGKPSKRAKKPRCPFCGQSALETVERKRSRSCVQCPDCSMTWWIRRPPRAPRLVKE